jgi:hypothetical protein
MSFASAIQEAVFERLAAQPNLTVYDDVPKNKTFPYVVVGEDTHVPFDTDDSLGAESTVTIHVWSRYRGKKEAKDIQGVVYDALTRQDLTIAGYDLITIEFDYSDVMLDADGITRHGVQRFRFLTEKS